MKKIIFQYFAPIILAILIVTGLMIGPLYLIDVPDSTIKSAATSLSDRIFRGQKIKNEAIDSGYIPMLGSSELSRFDVTHPSVLAQKYNREHQPFLMGKPGTKSLVQYYNVLSMGEHINNKKVIFIISPQWFVKSDGNWNSFNPFVSDQEYQDFLQQDNLKSFKNVMGAKRTLAWTQGNLPENYNNLYKDVAQKKTVKFEPNKSNQVLSENMDTLYSSFINNPNTERINCEMAKLPDKFSPKGIKEAATKEAKRETNNNDFEIKNDFYKSRLKANIGKMKNSQVNLQYDKSPEFTDFQLVLNEFADRNVDVLFIIPPVNKHWMDYTGLKKSTINRFSNKIKQQLDTQGFHNVVDFTQDGDQDYFMEDTIHIGWNGWAKADKFIEPFSREINHQPMDYKINNYYYSNDWAFK